MSKLTPILIYGVLGLVLLVAGYIFCLGLRNIWRGLASPHWPKAMGVVISSDPTQSQSYDKKTRQTDTLYGANIAFRYNVNNQTYTTSLLYFGQTISSGDPTEAQLRMLRYPMGAEVPIFYNPGNPAIAAAEPGYHSESLLLLMAGLLFGLPTLMAGVILSGNTWNGGVGDRVNAGMGIAAGLFASLFAMAGIAALAFGLINLWRAHASESWPTAPGKIAYQSLDSGGGGSMSDHLVFVYEVNDKKYYSNVRSFGLLASSSDEEADKAQARYPQDAEVTVHYSPDNPNLGVLEPGIASEAYILPGIGVVVLLFATAVFVFIVPAVSQPFPKMPAGEFPAGSADKPPTPSDR